MQKNLLAAVYSGHEPSSWQREKELKGNLSYNIIIFIALQWFIILQNGVKMLLTSLKGLWDKDS